MKLRLVVIGKNGRLGAAICRELAPSLDLMALGREEVDLLQPVASQMSGLKFDVLINASAATNVDWCEKNPEACDRINNVAVEELAEIASRQGARMIHISTDYVFDGSSTWPYREEDLTDPISFYGTSKRNGEERLLNVSAEHLAIRVSWLFGVDKPSFVDSLLERAMQEPSVEAIADKFSSPTFTLDFVSWLRPLLEEKSLSGLLHLCNQGGCSWQEFGQVALDEARKTTALFRSSEVQPVFLSSMKSFIAKRPVYTVLDTGKFEALSGLRPRSWEEAVREYVRQKFGGKR